MSEMRTAWRQLRQAPAFAIASIVTLALGIGANTVLFSVADAVVFHPLGFANEDRLVIAGEDSVEPRSEIARERLLKWRVRTRAFDQIEAMVSSNFAFKIAGPDPIPIEYRAVSAGFFDLLGVPPALGRGFAATDDHRNAARVLVLSHGLWQRQFGGDPAVIGRTIVLEDVGLNAGRSTSFTIVGVMPAYFRYPLGAQIWTPLVPMLASITGPGLPDFVDSPDGNILFAIARLKPRIAIAQAHADLDRVTADLRAEAGQQQRVASRVTPLLDDLLGSTRLNLWALLGAAGLLFLVASANVAGLLLTRTSIRRREFAIRAALGATRGAISRQILAESFLLAVGATIVAVLAAWLTLPAALALVPDTTPRIDGVAMNVRAIVFTLIAGALTTLLCWAAPALNADGARIDVLLRSAGRAFTSGGFSRRARRALVSVEIAIAVVVLTCSGLLLRSVSRLDRIDLGFDPHNLAAAYVDRPARYDGNAENVRRFADDVIATIGRQPAVSAVAGVGPRQLGSRFELEGQPAQDVQRNPLTTVSLVTPTYFSTLETPVVGRSFTSRDDTDAPLVTIVNQAFARLAWPGQSPLGKRLKFWDHDRDGWRTVVGVVPDVRYPDLAVVPPTLYVPDRQIDIPVWGFMIRTRGPVADVNAVRRWLRDINPAGFAGVGVVDDELAVARRPWASNLAIFSCFAGFTVLLAIVGLYALISSAVVEQSRDIGVRLALGATGGRIIREVMARGAGVVLAGLIVGLGASIGLTRLVRSMLFDVSPLDTVTLAAAPVILACVAALACLLPARRAARVDPIVSLRAE